MLFFVAKSLIALVCFYLLLYFKERKLFIPSLNIKRIFSLPMFNRSSYIGSLSEPLGSQADKLILGIIGGTAALPLYLIAQRALASIHSIVYNISYSFFPLLAAEGNNAITKAKQIDFDQRWTIGFVGAVCYSLAIIILPLIFSVTAGKEIGARLIPLIALAAFQGILVCNASIPIMGLMALKETKVLAINSWINQIIMLIATIVLTYYYGAIGTATARAAFLFQMTHVIWMYCSKIGITGIGQMFRPVAFSLTYMFLILFFDILLTKSSFHEGIIITTNLIISLAIFIILIFSEYRTSKGKDAILQLIQIVVKGFDKFLKFKKNNCLLTNANNL